MINYIYPLASVIIVSLVSLAGIFALTIQETLLKKYLFVLVSLAVGALLGDAFIHLIPEAFEKISDPTHVSLAIIGGIIIFFVLEKFLHWHHHDVSHTHEGAPHPIGRLVLISDGLHNLMDGLIIGASYMVSVEVGIATTIAVILHEIPQEIGDFGVLIHAGYTKARALWLNFVSALLAIVGVLIIFLVGERFEPFMVWLLPITAGGFIYIALSDLIPELHKTKVVKHSSVQFFAIAFGVLAMILLLAIE